MLIYGISSVLGLAKQDKDAAAALQSSLNGTVHPLTNTVSDTPQLPPSSLFPITPDMVNMALETLEEGAVKQMIRDCLNPIADMRPSAKNLLFHAAFFEVPTLKQIAAFAFVDYFCKILTVFSALRIFLPSN
jgi:hypothetical protein